MRDNGNQKRMHALPGMGGDRRMFPDPWRTLPGFAAHDWPVHRGERTLAAVASSLCEKYAIRDGDIVVGASLGGMVACEIARIRNLDALYLVGSATDKNEVSRILAFLHPLANPAPLEWLQFLAGKIPADLAQMFSRADASFVRSMCAAVFEWEGLGSTPVRCFRIHGRRDRIIPAPARVDLRLDGGHLISVTHAAECVRFITETATSRPVGR